MNLLLHRPWVSFCLGYILSCGFLYAGGTLPYASGSVAVIFTFTAFLLLLAGRLFRCFRPGGEGHRLLIFGAAGILLGCLVSCLHPGALAAAKGGIYTDDGLTHQSEGVITEVQYSGDGLLIGTASVTEIDGKEIPAFRVQVSLSDCSDLAAGDPFSAALQYTLPAEWEDGYANRRTLAADGIFAEATGDFLSNGTPKIAGAFSPILSLRQKLNDLLLTRLPADEAGLAVALLTGQRKLLPTAAKRDFRTLGISHLLAVSGLHLAILAGALDWLLRRRKLSAWLRMLLESLFVVGYMGLCGFSGSITRAGLMYLLYLGGCALGQRGDGVTSLCSAGWLILLAEPWRVLDVGLQLSFLATLGILTLGRELLSRPAVETRPSLGRKLWNALAVSFSAVCFTFPVSVWMSGRFSLLGPLMTLLLTPLFALLLYLLPLALLLSPIPFISGFLFYLIEKLAAAIYALAGLARFCKGSCLPLPDGKIALLCGGFLLVCLLVLILPLRKKWLRRLPLYLLAVILLYSGVRSLLPASSRLLYLQNDGGSAEAMLLRSDSCTALIDVTTGGKELYRTAEAELSRVESAGVDTLVLTHLHERHAAALGWLSENDYLTRLLLPAPESEEEKGIYENLKAIAERRGIAVESYSRNGSSALALGSIRFSALPRVALGRSSHPCIGFKLQKENVELLYLGSAYPAPALSDLSLSGVDYLISGVHGPIAKPEDPTDYAAFLPPGTERLSPADGWILAFP